MAMIEYVCLALIGPLMILAVLVGIGVWVACWLGVFDDE